jgi:hypothetical protein
MISQLSDSGSGGAATWNMEGRPTDQAVSRAQLKNAGDVPLEGMKRGSPTISCSGHLFNSEYLDAYIERRKKLTVRIRAEHPTFTDAEIEERLEQFGA